jgi:hypothetical protein
MDNFKGYPPGYRVIVRTGDGLKRAFLTTNWSTEARVVDLTRAWMQRLREFKAMPPK